MLKIDPSIAQDLDERATKLLQLLQPAEANSAGLTGTTRPNHLSYDFNPANEFFPHVQIESVFGMDGNEVARFFLETSPLIGLDGKNHAEFVELCLTIHELEGFDQQVSLTSILETTFKWMRREYEDKTDVGFTEYLTAFCASSIAEREMWIPVNGLQIESTLEFGALTITTLSSENVEGWRTEWNLRRPEQLQYLDPFLQSIGEGRLTVSQCKTYGDPIRAVELAIRKTEDALTILRYFSHANFFPEGKISLSIAGNETLERPKHMFVVDGLIVVGGTTESNPLSKKVWTLTAESLANMKKAGFDKLVEINSISRDERTDFQQSFLEALSTLSKAVLSSDPSDKLMYNITALESLLLKNSSEPIQKSVGERMALVVGRNLAERLDIIRSFKNAYKLRSAFVHHGDRVLDREAVERLLYYAWWTFNRIIPRSDRYRSKEDFIDELDDVKFS